MSIQDEIKQALEGASMSEITPEQQAEIAQRLGISVERYRFIKSDILSLIETIPLVEINAVMTMMCLLAISRYPSATNAVHVGFLLTRAVISTCNDALICLFGKEKIHEEMSKISAKYGESRDKV